MLERTNESLKTKLQNNFNNKLKQDNEFGKENLLNEKIVVLEKSIQK